MRLLYIFGTRPGLLKASVFIKEAPKWDVELVTVDTGQHYDENMQGIFYDEMKFSPDYSLGVKSDGPNQVSKIIFELKRRLLFQDFDYVFVSGDTNSTLAGAVWAVVTNQKLIHYEAGMRCWDMKLPEERIRQAVDGMSNVLLCTTLNCQYNILHSIYKYPLQKTSFVVGDVMLDLFYRYYYRTEEYNLPYPYVLTTIHRQENMDKSRMNEIFEAMRGNDKLFLFVVHPRTWKFIDQNYDTKDLPDNLIMREAVGYFEMLSMIKGAKEIWTDSGGLQREAIFAGKKCKVWRNSSEWRNERRDNFGDGNAAARTFECLNKWIG